MKILIPLYLIVVVFSCKKQTPVTATPKTQADSTYLDKVIRSDSSGIFIQHIFTQFSYDNLKRVNAIKDSNSSTNTFTFVLFQKRTNIFYSGSDSLPNKSVATLHRLYGNNNSEPELFDTTSIFYFYNGSGKKIKDSTVYAFKTMGLPFPNYEKGTIVSYYSYVANKIIGQIFKSYSSTVNNNTQNFSALYTDTAILNASGNISNNYFYVAPLKYTHISFTYDNKPNPFRHIAHIQPTLPQSQYWEGIEGHFWAKNNAVTRGEDYHNYSVIPHQVKGFMTQFLNQYQDNGFLKESRVQFISTKRFFYRTL